MHASMRANRIFRLLPTPIRLGFDRKRARDFQFFFTNQRIAAASGEHALDAMMGFARHIGAAPTPMRWDIPMSDADREFGDAQCRYPTLAISPCSSQRSRNFRNWPVERFAEVADHAQASYGARIVLTGSGSELEMEYGRRISEMSSADIVNLIGQTNLKQSLAVFDAADALLCPDSGPAHMATAVGTPVIGLYATSNPQRTGPYVSRQLTVDRYAEALTAYMGKTTTQVRWGQRVRHPDAMQLITVDDVTEKLDTVFSH
jgi:heptosyltransferase I